MAKLEKVETTVRYHLELDEREFDFIRLLVGGCSGKAEINMSLWNTLNVDNKSLGSKFFNLQRFAEIVDK